MVAVMQARHDDVAALDQAHGLRRLYMRLLVEEVLHPRAGSIHEPARGQLDRAAVGCREFDIPALAVVAAVRRHAAMAGVDRRPHVARRLHVRDHQPRIVDPAVRIDEAVLEGWLQPGAELRVLQVDTDRFRQRHVPVEMVVEKEAEAQHPARPEMRFVRQHEAQRPGDVRRLCQQHLTLHQRLAYQSELVLLEIAQATVDELGRLRRRAAGEIVHLAEPDLECASRGIARNPRPIYAAADYEQVERLALRSIHRSRYSALDRLARGPQKAAWASCSRSRSSPSWCTAPGRRCGAGPASWAADSRRHRRPLAARHHRRRRASRSSKRRGCVRSAPRTCRLAVQNAVAPTVPSPLDREGGGPYFAAPQKRP